MAKTSKVSKRTISLSVEQAAFVDAKVASGDYASVSEVIREGLRVVKARHDEIEHWLRTEVVPTYERHLADPSSARSADEVLDAIYARHEQLSLKRA